MDLEDVVAPELRPVVHYLFTGDEGALKRLSVDVSAVLKMAKPLRMVVVAPSFVGVKLDVWPRRRYLIWLDPDLGRVSAYYVHCPFRVPGVKRLELNGVIVKVADDAGFRKFLGYAHDAALGAPPAKGCVRLLGEVVVCIRKRQRYVDEVVRRLAFGLEVTAKEAAAQRIAERLRKLGFYVETYKGKVSLPFVDLGIDIDALTNALRDVVEEVNLGDLGEGEVELKCSSVGGEGLCTVEYKPSEEFLEGQVVEALENAPRDVHRFDVGDYAVEYFGVGPVIGVEAPFAELQLELDTVKELGLIYAEEYVAASHPARGRRTLPLAKPTAVEVKKIDCLSNYPLNTATAMKLALDHAH